MVKSIHWHRTGIAAGSIALFLGASLCVAVATPNGPTAASMRGRSVLLTVFGDFGVVRDTRDVALNSGMNHISFPEISPLLSPQTAFLTDVRSDHPVWVTEQSFDDNLISANSLYQSYAGHTVTVITTNPKTLATSHETATLISTDGPILKFRDRIEVGIPPNARIVYGAIPSSLLVEPALEADIGTTAAGPSRLALTYLSGGFGWSADYIMRLDQAVDQADLDVLATVTNGSGADYPNARLQFVSGDVQHMPVPEALEAAKVLGHVTTNAAAMVTSDTYTVGGTTRQPLLEFYLYTLPNPTTLLKSETKQFTLLAAQSVPVHETFEVGYSSPNSDVGSDGETPLGVETYVGFTDKGPKLGIPLPSGVVHIYKDDESGISEFVGEASVDRTPRLGSVKLDLGQSSDVSAKHVQTYFHQVYGRPTPSPSPNVVTYVGPMRLLFTDTTERITVANAKTKPVSVDVYVQMPTGWGITSESVQHAKLSSSLVKWTVDVPPSASTALVYSVRVTQVDE